MSTMMHMGNGMFMPIPHYLIPFQVQNPNSTTLHDRDDPTSNLFNMVLPGFDYLPIILVSMIEVVAVLVYSRYREWVVQDQVESGDHRMTHPLLSCLHDKAGEGGA
jgi:hypothetical protein